MSLKILMICLGNICRSPIAHGLLQHKVTQRGLDWEIDSAGLLDWHEGELPHPKSVSTMKQRGIDITYQRSRPITPKDLHYYDLIYVMDKSNYQAVVEMATTEEEAQKVIMIMNEVEPDSDESVPDPYGKDDSQYQLVYDMLDKATERIIEKFSKR